MVNKQIKRCLTPLIISELKIKTTVKYHFTLTRMAIKKKKRKIKVGKDVEKLEHLDIAVGNIQLCHHYGKQFESSSII